MESYSTTKNEEPPGGMESQTLAEWELQALQKKIRTHALFARERRKTYALLISILLAWILWTLICGLFPLSILGGLFLLCVVLSGLLKRKEDGFEQLARLDDVRAVGLLVEVFAFSNVNTQARAREALVRLLPRLRVTDAAILTEEHRAELRNFVTERDPAFTLAILTAYQQIGDERDLRVVEDVLEQEWRSPVVHDAARACLPFLQARSKLIQSSQTLLRAAVSPVLQPDKLLRPAHSTQTTDPDELLRPTSHQIHE